MAVLQSKSEQYLTGSTAVPTSNPRREVGLQDYTSAWCRVREISDRELTTGLSASVKRELSLLNDHSVSVDCRGIGDVGGLTKAVAVGILGEAVSLRQICCESRLTTGGPKPEDKSGSH